MQDDSPRSEPPIVQVEVTFTRGALEFAEGAIRVMAIDPAATISRDRWSVGAVLPLVCAVAHTTGTAAFAQTMREEVADTDLRVTCTCDR